MNGTSPYAARSVLVTGATGFIGTRLCARLLEMGAVVHGVDRRAPEADAPTARWHCGDLSDEAFVERVFEETRPAVVFHLASYVVGSRDMEMVRPTLRDILAATVNVLLAASGHGKPRVVLAGSLEEPDASTAIPSSPYAAAKFACTAYAGMFHALYQLPVVNARLFMVYGPGQRDRRKLVPYTILSLQRGETPELSAGDRLVDWIYVDDLVDGLCALGERPGMEGRRFDLGSGTLTAVRTVSEQIVRIVRPDIQPRFGAIAARPMEQVRKADVEATFQATGWRAHTSLEAGLMETARWYAAHPADRSAT